MHIIILRIIEAARVQWRG